MGESGRFEDRLKSAIREAGCSYEALAAEVGISPKTLSRYVQGQRVPRLDLAAELARALKKDLLWLLGFDGAEQSAEELDRGERILLEKYRLLSSHGKTKAIAYLTALSDMFPAGQAGGAILPSPASDEAEAAPAEGPLSAEVSPAPLSPEDAERIVKEVCSAYNMDWLGMRQTSNIAIISAIPAPDLSGDRLLSHICDCTAEIMSRLFAASALKTISFFFKAHSGDPDCSEQGETIVKLILSQPALKPDTEAWKSAVSRDYNNLLKTADEYFVHPALKSELRELKP